MIHMADEMIDVTFSDDEVKALETAYGLKVPGKDAAPDPQKKPDKVEKVAAAPDQNDLVRRLNETNARLAEERKRRMEAEKLAHERGATVAVSQARAAESDLVAVSNALVKATNDIETWKAAHKAALEAGDYEKASEAADKLAEVRAKITSLEDGKAQLEQRANAAKAKADAAAKAEPPASEAADPADAFLSQFDARAQQWFRDHPECMPMNDRAAYFRAMAANETVMRSGVKVGTDEYFAALDREMGFAGKDDAKVEKSDKSATAPDDVVVDTKVAAAESKPTVAPRVSAPVSRDDPIVKRGSDGRFKVQLTREQAEMADAMGISHTAYARNLVLAQQQGRLGVSN